MLTLGGSGGAGRGGAGPVVVSDEQKRKMSELKEARYGGIRFVHQDNLQPSCNVINDALRHYGLPGELSFPLPLSLALPPPHSFSFSLSSIARLPTHPPSLATTVCREIRGSTRLPGSHRWCPKHRP